jgi:hypothetical protein
MSHAPRLVHVAQQLRSIFSIVPVHRTWKRSVLFLHCMYEGPDINIEPQVVLFDVDLGAVHSNAPIVFGRRLRVLGAEGNRSVDARSCPVARAPHRMDDGLLVRGLVPELASARRPGTRGHANHLMRWGSRVAVRSVVRLRRFLVPITATRCSVPRPCPLAPPRGAAHPELSAVLSGRPSVSRDRSGAQREPAEYSLRFSFAGAALSRRSCCSRRLPAGVIGPVERLEDAAVTRFDEQVGAAPVLVIVARDFHTDAEATLGFEAVAAALMLSAPP